MKKLKSIFTHHATTHSLISLLIQFTIWHYFSSLMAGAIIASLFYTIREFWQFYVLGKTHNDRFDWLGCVPVIVVTFSIALVF